MEFFDPRISFDPKRPFYGLVVAYCAQVHGLIDLCSRGLREVFLDLKSKNENGPMSKDAIIDTLCSGTTKGYDSFARKVLETESSPLFGVQRFASRTGKSLRVKTDILSRAFFHDHKDPINYFAQMSAGSLLIASWELTRKFHDANPLWEFHRHCRNAAAHNASFTFRNKEPRRAARWRSLEITRELRDTPLFQKDEHRGYIGPGDVLYLLADIERKLL